MNVLNYLEKTQQRFPDKIAVIDEFGTCTYSQLINKSMCVGSGLSIHNKFRSPFIVFMDKGINALISFFGVIYSGNFYVLVNPDLPHSRIMQIYNVLEKPVVITDHSNVEVAKELFLENNVLLIDDLSNTQINYEFIDKTRSVTTDVDPVYANFTSGSTGVPKGVLVCHRSIIDFIDVFTDLFDINETDIIGNQAPFDFDVSVKDVYSAIKTGATLVVVPRKLFSQPPQLLDFICDHNITVMTWAVSALCLISTFHGLDYKTPETVKKVLFSGEVMPKKHLDSWMDKLPNATFVNLYGPTEITCNCTYHIIDRNRNYSAGIPIGKPFPNEDVFLLDDENNIVTEMEVPGEICVRGSALALGYYNAPEQTQKAFVQNPANNKYIDLIYRTGDLGKYGPNNEIYFCGRKDFQIKHMGHRIELEEIENAMSAIEGIERCCCIFDSDKSKLYGFYVGTIDKKELYSKLKETLPIFMVPGALRKIDEMPLSKNGKILRSELLDSVKGKKK